jgi:hypothetical protein
MLTPDWLPHQLRWLHSRDGQCPGFIAAGAENFIAAGAETRVTWAGALRGTVGSLTRRGALEGGLAGAVVR